MQNSRFVVLTGHLSNYPLSDLVGILRHQKKTGRLLIEYSKGPAMFFFQEGELIDARLNDLSGLQAICVALAQPDAAFNFNPLIPATRRSIEPSLQRAVSELFGCWDESALQIEATAANRQAFERQATRPAFERHTEPLALPPAPPLSRIRQRPLLFMAAAVLIGVGLSTVIVVTAGFSANPPAAAASAIERPPTTQQPNPLPSVSSALPIHQPVIPPKTKARPPKTSNTDNPDNTADKTDQKPPSIKVVMQIENGRVVNASIANRKPGMDNYEALALRIARQRRFAPSVNGGQTVTISVGPQQ
ncbi:MAG TPA: DUF4388 domain-containing protein [Pyrinomonadaceae bacterium]|jgi:hypothetical protein|nr:DUF4388 domain-containing protein [Pyrinomonadaceae bacterium]